MKSVGKLKTERYSSVYRMTNEEAEQAYKTGHSKDNKSIISDMPCRVSCGFYALELTFEEWLSRYHIVIV